MTRELATGDFALYASADYLKRHGVPRTGADLARHRLLRQRLPGESLDHLRLFDRERDQEQVVTVTPVLVTDSPGPLLSATLSGAVISSQGQTIGARYIAAGQLRRVRSVDHQPHHASRGLPKLPVSAGPRARVPRRNRHGGAG